MTPPDTDPALTPDSPSQRQILPVARRFAGRGTAFPLLWRPRGTSTERIFCFLREEGRRKADEFLAAHADNIGRRSTVEIEKLLSD
jgi:hypothetical protein